MTSVVSGTGGSYIPEEQSWGNTPLCAADTMKDVAAVFAPWGRLSLPFIGGIDISWASLLPETNQGL